MKPSQLFHDCLRVEQDEAIAHVIIDREEHNNSISNSVRQAIIEAMDAIEASPDVRCVVLRGEGEEAFSAGADIGEYARMAPTEIAASADLAAHMHQRLTDLPLPIIAAIRGGCTGAGFELALHCDVRFALEDARFGFPGMGIGLTSGGGALWRLSQLAGAGPARALAMTGAVIGADRAFMLGLLTNVLKVDDYEGAIMGLANHFCGMSPHALAETKKLMNLSMEANRREMDAAGVKSMQSCFEDGDAADALAQMFGSAMPDVTVH